MAPWGYAQLQVLAQAIEATKSLDDKKLADYIRTNTFKTVLGDVKFGKGGEWAQSRVLQVQFHDIKGNDVEQFRTMGTQTLLDAAGVRFGQRDLSVRKGEVSVPTRSFRGASFGGEPGIADGLCHPRGSLDSGFARRRAPRNDRANVLIPNPPFTARDRTSGSDRCC